MKKYIVTVECSWPDSDPECVINRDYTVRAESVSDAKSIAEDRAMADSSFNLGEPEQVCADQVQWIV